MSKDDGVVGLVAAVTCEIDTVRDGDIVFDDDVFWEDIVKIALHTNEYIFPDLEAA